MYGAPRITACYTSHLLEVRLPATFVDRRPRTRLKGGNVRGVMTWLGADYPNAWSVKRTSLAY